MSIQSDLSDSDKVADALLASTERQITNAYKQSYTDLKAIFADAFAKYETGGKLTYAEMMKYNRLKAMQVELDKSLQELYRNNKSVLYRELTSTYQSSYYRTAYAIEKEVMAKLSYMPLDVAGIKAAIESPIPFGKTMRQILGENLDAVISKINQEVTRSLINGQSYGKTANAIKEVLGNDAKKAILVARTESHRIHMEARLDSSQHAEDVGVEMVKVWVATLDDRTRDTHRTLDGQEADKNGNFHSESGAVGPAPGHMGTAAEDIQCRCTFVDRIAGTRPEFRRIRGEGVVPFKTFREWEKAKGLKGD